jgi:enamine deaminase RidA (YjgF/YER057c/UK114 family)
LRAVRAGQHVHVAGTTATKAAGRPGRRWATSGDALERARASLAQVVRTRIFEAGIGQWEAIGRAHGRVSGETRPTATMVEARRPVHPDMLVEIEAGAHLGE